MKEFIISRNENEEWIVRCKNMPGFTAKGKTREEAIEKMRQAFSVYFPCGDCKDSS